MLIRDGIVYLLARAVPGIIGLMAVAALTRFLSPEDYGRYALIFAAASLFQGVFLSWNFQAVFRHYSGASLNKTLPALLTCGAVGFGLSLFATGISAASFYAAMDFGIGLSAFLAGLALLLALAMADLTSMLLNVSRRVRHYALLQAGRALVNLLVGGGVAYWTGSPTAVILAMAVSWLILSLAIGWPTWWPYLARNAFNIKLLRELFRYGFPLSLSIALMQIVGALDRGMLAHFSGIASVGRYSVGFDLVQFTIGALGAALSLAFYPHILQILGARGESAARETLQEYCGFQLALLLPAAIGFAVLAPGISNILIGAQIRNDAMLVIPWICAAIFLGVIKSYYTDFAFQLGKWTMGSILTAAVTLAANAAFNMVLIPRYGAIGAAQASLASFTFAILFSIWLGQSRGFRLIFPWRDITKVAISASIMGAMLIGVREFTSPLALIGQIIAGVLIYGSALLLLNAVGARDRFARCVHAIIAKREI